MAMCAALVAFAAVVAGRQAKALVVKVKVKEGAGVKKGGGEGYLKVAQGRESKSQS